MDTDGPLCGQNRTVPPMDAKSVRQCTFAVAVGEIFAVGAMVKGLSIEEGFDAEARVVGHEQARLNVRLFEAAELGQCRGQYGARGSAVSRFVAKRRDGVLVLVGSILRLTL